MAVASLNQGSPAEVFGQHLAFCEVIEEHGYLVYGNKDEVVSLLKGVREAGPEVLQVWTALIKRFSRLRRSHMITPPCEVGIDEICDRTELANGWTPTTDVAVVADERASAIFGLAETEMSSEDDASGVEIVRIAAASVSGTFARHKQRGRASVLLNGTSRDELWDHYLGPIARVSSSMTIVDRYLFKNLEDLTNGRGAQGAFLSWFIERLDQEASEGCRLEVIGYDTRTAHVPARAQDAAETMSAIAPTSPGQLARIDVTATQPATYLPHDRHILSNLGVGLTFNASFDTFNTETIRVGEGVEFSYRSAPRVIQKLQASEKKYREDPSATTAVAYQR